MPTYGILFFCAALNVYVMPLPQAYWLIASIGTFALTAGIPLSLIIIRLVSGRITTIQIRNPQERTPIYMYTIVCYGFWCYFLSGILHAPLPLILIAIGATIALAGVLVINRNWKISAHLTGMGGLIGGICAYCFCNALPMPTLLISGLLVLALFLMYSRLYTDEHTPLQVVCGLLYGMIVTCLPALIYSLFAHA